MTDTLLEYSLSLMDDGVPVELLVWKKVELPGDARLEQETRAKIRDALTAELAGTTSGCVTFKCVSDREPRSFETTYNGTRFCPTEQDLAGFARTMIDAYAKMRRCASEREFLEWVKVALEKDNDLTQPSHWVCRLAPGTAPMIYVGMPEVVIRGWVHQDPPGSAKITVQSKSTGVLVSNEVVRLGLHVERRVLRCPDEAPAQLASAIHDLIDVFGIT